MQTKEPPKVVKQPEVVIMITSKRGTVISNSQCMFCGDDFRTGWRYQSNRGPVFFCGPCKSRCLVAPHGLGMPKPREVVTNFETNRKRH